MPHIKNIDEHTSAIRDVNGMVKPLRMPLSGVSGYEDDEALAARQHEGLTLLLRHGPRARGVGERAGLADRQ